MKRNTSGVDADYNQELYTLDKPGEYVIRHGEALPMQEPDRILINGDIHTVETFLNTRFINHLENKGIGRQEVNINKAVITIDKDRGEISLELDPEDHYGSEISAKLEPSIELQSFHINGTYEFNQEKLVELIKFSRRYFENPEQHRIIFTAFQKFEASVQTDLKNEKDNRGNINALLSKKVSSQLPLEFKLNIPIFKGMSREVFPVEICFNVTDRGVSFWFESVALEELIEERKNEIFDEMTEAWKEFVIIYK